jgi:glutathione S-transferase
MAKTDLKLLGSWASPFVTRVQVALKLKSIEYEFVEENFYSGKSELLLKANPVYKKIPVLIHDEKPICESLVILQYIDESWTDGPSILPSNTYDRATARFWAAYVDDTWFVAFKELEKASDDEERAKVVAKIYECLALLEEAFVKSSKGGDFFGGDQVGYVDAVLGSYLGWMKVTELMAGLKFLDETKTPGLAKWAEKFGSHDTFKDVLPEPQKLIEFYMMVKAAKASS